MDQFSFIFTIFFMLLGPLKLIPIFAGLTRGKDAPFKRSAAMWGAVIAAGLCAFVALAGGTLVEKYRISFDAVRIAGGLVLLISALQAIFQKAAPPELAAGAPSAIQVAASPLAVPGIVPPAGIAAILLCMMLAPDSPGMAQAVALSLAIVMTLDYLVMRFIDQVLKTPGLGLVLVVLGSVLVFVQVGLAVEMILKSFAHLGVIKV